MEINLTDDSHLDEIINLFVDINQQGVRVGRFDIVKAMGANNQLLQSVFQLLALKQQRNQDIYYKAKKNDFTFVLRTIRSVANLMDAGSQVDRMWQQMLEIVLFQQSKRHRKPGDILKAFISGSHDPKQKFPAMTASDKRALKTIFKFLATAYQTSGLARTSLATDQTRFYTMVTALIGSNVMSAYSPDELVERLVKLSLVLDEKVDPKNKKLEEQVDEFILLASDRTTDAPRRDTRQILFLEMLQSNRRASSWFFGEGDPERRTLRDLSMSWQRRGHPKMKGPSRFAEAAPCRLRRSTSNSSSS